MLKEDEKKFLIKLLIAIGTFTLVAIIFTIIMINVTNSNSNVDMFKKIGEESKTDCEGIGKEDKYKNNSLTIDKKEIVADGITITIPYIDGLKSSTIENKINDELKNRSIQMVKDVRSVSENGYNFYYSEYGNFANILSIALFCYRYSDGQLDEDDFYEKEEFLNFDLTTGKQITYRQLFVSDEAMTRQTRKAITDSLVIDKFYEQLCEDYEDYDWDDKKVDTIDEEELYNIYRRIINQDIEDIKFTVTKSGINVYDTKLYRYYPAAYTINISDALEDIAIYNRFKTQDSIFDNEKEDIIEFYCCQDRDNNNFFQLEFGDYSSNLFVDAAIYEYDLSNNTCPTHKYDDLKALLDKVSDETLDLIKEYSDSIKNDKNNHYVLSLNVGIDPLTISAYERKNVTEDNPDGEGEYLQIFTDYANITTNINKYKMKNDYYDNTFKDIMIDNFRETSYVAPEDPFEVLDYNGVSTNSNVEYEHEENHNDYYKYSSNGLYVQNYDYEKEINEDYPYTLPFKENTNYYDYNDVKKYYDGSIKDEEDNNDNSDDDKVSIIEEPDENTNYDTNNNTNNNTNNDLSSNNTINNDIATQVYEDIYKKD